MQSHLSVWRNASAKSTKKSDVLDIVAALEERMPWQAARRVLEQCGVPVQHGWANTLHEISVRDFLPLTNLDGLYAAFLQHVTSGEKSVKLFDIGDHNADALRKHFRSLPPLHRVERPRLKSSLKRAKPADPTLTYFADDQDGITAVFQSIVRREEHVEIAYDALPDDAKPMFSEFEEIIAIKPTMHQAYGVLHVPSHGRRVEVRVDDLFGDNRKAVADHHQKMYAQLHTRADSKVVMSPVELFGAIKQLYDASQEGVVVALSFATTTGSIKDEKMRSTTCLRQEAYHVGGKIALKTEIEPFKITVQWRRPVAGTDQLSTPELHLHGTVNSVGSESGVFEATVRRVAGSEEYDWVRDKLLEYI